MQVSGLYYFIETLINIERRSSHWLVASLAPPPPPTRADVFGHIPAPHTWAQVGTLASVVTRISSELAANSGLQD